MSITSSLLTPLQLGSTTIRNRITMSSLTRNRAPGTIPNDLMKEYYVQRARGGAGLIVTEGALISCQATEWPHAPGIWNTEQVVGWKKIVNAVHDEGAKIYVQLWHVGRAAHPDPEQKLAGVLVHAPSAIPASGGRFRHIPGEPGYAAPTAFEDPWTLVKQFKDAAVLAKEAGFDGVELQGGGGYLITQFLDYSANQRTDEWGGSIENRSRFGLEVIRAIKEVFGNDVAIKLAPALGFNDVGMSLQDAIETYSYFIKEADKLDLSYIVLMRYSDAERFNPTIDGKKRAAPHDILAIYAPLIKKSKVVANLGITPEEGGDLVSSGIVDAVAFGISYVNHPDLAKRVEHGKPLDNGLQYHRMQWCDVGNWDDMRVGYTDYPEAVY